jgi:ribosome-associated protein
MQTLQTPPKKYSEALTTDKAASIAAWLTEHKAADLVCLNVAGNCAFTDCLLVLTASSVRHAQSLADGISALCTEQNFEFLRMEGYQAGQWILVDLNDIVINIFQPSVRDLYKLESLWQMPERPSPDHGIAAKGE